ncbi:MAG: CPBP family intramembrane glutamic endopeptidase [Thermoanaerobaculia bacterium]|nr:CPBP family intramembrane glutamic endopeptidase [Thermoanaerobaculia bacterium]
MSVIQPETRPVARRPAGAGHRLWLALEFAALFFGVPAVMTLGPLGGSIIPCLLAAFGLALLYLLRDPGFDRRELWNAAPFAREARRFVPRFLVLAALIALCVALFDPSELLNFPRRRPGIWLAVMLLYPLLSVYPQELLFRTFLFRRYRALFGGSTALVWASAAAFAFVHILFESWLAVAFTLPGGLLFADTYRRSRSLLAASVEHALYGCFVFTIGLGRHFYNGA